MKKIICCVCSMMLALLIVGCDSKGNKDETSTTAIETTTSDKVELEKILNEKPINLDGTYDENDLLITTLEKAQGDIVMEIPQISGLLDSNIEAKINQEILEAVVKETENVSDLTYVGYNVNGNFANVISLVVYLSWEEDYSQIYFNYNLVNGEKIKLEDIFMSDTDILQIIREAFRRSLIIDELNPNYDENELYKIVKNFCGTEEKKFSFSASNIIFDYKDRVATVEMLDIADKVCIYSKYLTEDSIFECDDIGRKGMYTCVGIPFDTFDIVEFGMLEDNLRYDFTAYREWIDEDEQEVRYEEYKAFKEKIYAEIYGQIEEYKEVAKNNPDKFYLIITKPSIYLDMVVDPEHEYRAFVNRNMQIIEMPREKYDNVYKQKLLETYRNKYFAINGGVYLDVSEEDVHCKEIVSEKIYDYITGEEIDY